MNLKLTIFKNITSFNPTVAAIMLFSFNSPPPNTKYLTGTMSGSIIDIGTNGVILGVLPGGVNCPSYSGQLLVVRFEGHEEVVICTGDQNLTENQNIHVSSYITDCTVDIYVVAGSK